MRFRGEDAAVCFDARFHQQIRLNESELGNPLSLR
jgi:hypothetical protein